MINIVSNFYCAFLTLVVLTGVFHVFLVYPKNLSKKNWKIVDYVWISLTAIGLVGSINTVKIKLADGKANIATHRTSVQHKFILSYLLKEGSHIVCDREFIWKESSPSNFNEIVKDFERCCDWSKEVYKIVASIDTISYTWIDVEKIPDLKTESNQWFKQTIIDGINHYNSLVTEKIENEKVVDNYSNSIYSFLLPLFLIIGLALRLTKVTGELLHEKNKP